jgi:hypothetical protein
VSARSRWLRSRRPSTAAITLFVALAAVFGIVLVVLVRIWTVEDRTLGDLALIEIETRRVVSWRPPGLGAYSRFGWRHPGPALFYVLTVPYHLLGSSAQALATGVVLVNAVSMLGVVYVTKPRGPAAVAAMSAALLMMVSGMGVDGIGYPWNVSVTLVPLMLVVLACWGVLSGDRVAVPIMIVAYLFILHAHVGAGVVATPLVGVTALGVWRNPALRERLASSRRVLLVAACALVAFALPMAIDIARNPPGNLGRILRWSVTNNEEPTGWIAATRLLARTSSLSFPFDPEQPRFILTAATNDLGVLPGMSVVLLVALLAACWHRRLREEAILVGLMLVFWLSGLIAARSIVNSLEWWLVEWLQPLGWLTVGTLAFVAWRLISTAKWGPYDRVRQFGLAAAAVAMLVAVIGEIRTTAVLDDRMIEAVTPVAILADAVEDASMGEVVSLRLDGPDFAAASMLTGVVNELDSRGVRVCVDEALAYQFPPSMICSGGEASQLILRMELTAEPSPPGHLTLAVSDNLSPDLRARADSTREQIADALAGSGRQDLVPLLDTALVADVLLDGPAEILLGLTDEILWLDSIRQRPGLRYRLFEAQPM